MCNRAVDREVCTKFHYYTNRAVDRCKLGYHEAALISVCFLQFSLWNTSSIESIELCNMTPQTASTNYRQDLLCSTLCRPSPSVWTARINTGSPVNDGISATFFFGSLPEKARGQPFSDKTRCEDFLTIFKWGASLPVANFIKFRPRGGFLCRLANSCCLRNMPKKKPVARAHVPHHLVSLEGGVVGVDGHHSVAGWPVMVVPAVCGIETQTILSAVGVFCSILKIEQKS